MAKKTQVDGKQKVVKTPLESAKNKIQAAYVAAFISAGFTLLFILIAMFGYPLVNGINLLTLVDVALLILLGVLIAKLKSRVAAVILFVYFLLSKVFLYMENPGVGTSSMYMTIVFLIAYFNGILGTFAYQKIKEEGGLMENEVSSLSEGPETKSQE